LTFGFAQAQKKARKLRAKKILELPFTKEYTESFPTKKLAEPGGLQCEMKEFFILYWLFGVIVWSSAFV
jgi:hypothetical protein